MMTIELPPRSDLQASWANVFVFGPPDQPESDIRIAQVDERQFRLDSRIEYLGTTGLEEHLPETTIDQIRVIESGDLPLTDLASVPGLLRWFLPSYGIHTPAALIHDRLIPTTGTSPLGLTDEHTDTYFRHMLAALGVPRLRRWLMWSAVAYRTRLVTRTVLAVTWTAAALIGIASVLVGSVFGNEVLVVVGLVGPLPASLLWWGQHRAGLIAAACAVFIVPPTVVAALGYGLYWLLERLLERVLGRGRATKR